MARSDLPDNSQDLAAGHVLNNLSEEEVLSWKALLAQHPELSDEVEELQTTFNLFADLVPMHQPPDRLLSQLRAKAQAELESQAVAQASLLKPSIPDRGKNLRRLVRVGSAIAALFITMLGVQLYALRSQLQQANAKIETLEDQLRQAQTQAQNVAPVVSTLQQSETLIYPLQGSELANTASGRLVMSNRQEVIILVQNLPELPKEKVYRLWAALPTQSTLTYCGQFNSNMQGVIQLTPSSAQCGKNPTQMIITIDAITDPTTRGGPVIMQGEI